MKTRLTYPRTNQKERGTILIIALFAAIVLGALVLYAYSDSQRAATESEIHANHELAISAAEYGAELTASLLAQSDNAGEDFVSTSLYRTGGGEAWDQRRIGGMFQDIEWRVRIRSARLAHEFGTMPPTWMSAVHSGKYGDIYEITSTARNPNVVGMRCGFLWPHATVQLIMGLESGGKDSPLDQVEGTLNIEKPSNVQAATLYVSGEDHNLKFFDMKGHSPATQEASIEGSGGATQSDDKSGIFFATSAGDFDRGLILVNYMHNELPIPFYKIDTKLSSGGSAPSGAYFNNIPGAQSMTFMDPSRPSGHYSGGTLTNWTAPSPLVVWPNRVNWTPPNIVEDSASRPNIQALLLDITKGGPYKHDTYFLGGGSHNPQAGAGRSLYLADTPGSTAHSVTMVRPDGTFQYQFVHPDSNIESSQESQDGKSFSLSIEKREDIMNLYAFRRAEGVAIPTIETITLNRPSGTTQARIPVDRRITDSNQPTAKPDGGFNFVGGISARPHPMNPGTAFHPYFNKFEQSTTRQRRFSTHYVLRKKPGGAENERQILVKNITPNQSRIAAAANWTRGSNNEWNYTAQTPWYDWDGTYVWSDFKIRGDNTHGLIFVRDAAGLSFPGVLTTQGSNVGTSATVNSAMGLYAYKLIIPRLFTVDEIIGYRTGRDEGEPLTVRYNRAHIVNSEGRRAAQTLTIVDGKLMMGYDSEPVPLRGPAPAILNDMKANPALLRSDDGGIRVIDQTYNGTAVAGTARRVTSMEQFNETDGTASILVALVTGFEGQGSTHDPFGYNGVVFSINVVPPVTPPPDPGEEGYYHGEVHFNKYSQWWEQQTETGLTGKDSIAAISVNKVGDSADWEDAYKFLWTNLTFDDWDALADNHKARLLRQAGYPGLVIDAGNFAANRSIIIQALASDLYTSTGNGEEYASFKYLGQFRPATELDGVTLKEGLDAGLELDPRLIARINNDPERPPVPTIYYTDNDIAYYWSLLESLFIRFKPFIGMTGAERDEIRTVSWPIVDWLAANWYISGVSDQARFAEQMRIARLHTNNVGFTWSNLPGGLEKDLQPPDEKSGFNYNLEYIDARFTGTGLERTTANDNFTDEDGNVRSSALQVRDTAITARGFAAELFNKDQTIARANMPWILTSYWGGEFGAVDNGGGNYTTGQESLKFVAGEMVQEAGANHVARTGETVELNTNLKGSQADGTQVRIQLFLAECDNPSKWTDDELATAVDLCYVPYTGYDEDDWNRIRDLWGLKEYHRRYSIGFHRGGTSPVAELRAQYLLNHLELTVLGVKEYNPYYEINDPWNSLRQLVEKRRVRIIDDTDPLNPVETDEEREEVFLRAGNDLPTFQFDREIDGAGVLFVNGNLLITDTFAFNGILIVAGDIIVKRVEKPDRISYGPNGNPTYNGNSLMLGANGRYYYTDKDGNRVEVDEKDWDRKTDAPYTSRLVVQGALVASGVIQGDGEIILLHSETALDPLSKIFPGSEGLGRLRQLVWTHNDDIPTDTIWNDELDPVKP